MKLDKTVWKENLPFLFSCFSRTDTLDETAGRLGEFLSEHMALQSLILVYPGVEQGAAGRQTGVWNHGASTGTELSEGLTWEQLEQFGAERLGEKYQMERMELTGTGPEEKLELCGLPAWSDGRLCGFMFLLRPKDGKEDGGELLEFISDVLGFLFAFHTNAESEKLISFVFNTVLDGMKASIYISDPDTDRILFMNQTMKKEFGLKRPEGMICWQVLQKGLKKRCDYCPVLELKRRKVENSVIQWEEINTVTGKTYSNYDSLIKWVDGRTVHLQQSLDITDLKSANTDELTSLLTRRPGKDAMRGVLSQAALDGRTVTVCMYDINQLKEVNDLHGHAEGDRLISCISDAVCAILHEEEYAFRLSGDEFIVIFQSGQKNARQRLEIVRRNLKELRSDYEISFCYGLVEVSPGQPFTAEEALFLADERMYEQKRRFHIMVNEKKRLRKTAVSGNRNFEFNNSLLYDALVQSTDDYIYVCNMKTGIFRYTQAMAEEFDLPGEVIENAAAVWGARVHKDDRPAFLEANQEISDGRSSAHCVEYRAKNRKGEWVWVRCRGHVEYDPNGEPELFAGYITNLSKKNKIDHLTGLYNKLEFEEAARLLLEGETRQSFGIMVLGIDHLKHINDLYNRTFGDEVIRITSQKLLSLLPGTASLYRLDGDEFGVLLRSTDAQSNMADLSRLYQSVRQAFENQQEYEGKRYYCTLSAGCVICPEDADNYEDLMRFAGFSLEYSKNHGKKRCTFFSQEILSHRSRTLEMVEELRESIENDFEGFSLCFQPLVRAEDGQLTGAEALARWECERFGKVSPVEFIPLLEQSGLIVPMGKWVLHTALRSCKEWVKHLPGFILDVNLSYMQVQEADFVTFLRRELRKEQFPAENLVMELTESYFARENRRIQTVFKELRSLGVRIAMDDFGTGYSTLGILKEAPADIVKIDKTFIRDIQNSNFDATFIRFIVALCHDVGIRVCLEGVETEEEYKMVNSMGLDMIQGFLFDKPLTEKEFRDKYMAGESLTFGKDSV